MVAETASSPKRGESRYMQYFTGGSMKSIKHIFEQVTDYENLYKAYMNARICKRYRREVLRFSAHLEDNLTQIQQELVSGTYEFGKYREFYIYEPKQRLIMAQPFRDRVVQWAIYQLLHPIFQKGYISDSYACIEGRGTHSAVERLHYWLKQADRKPEKFYYLKLDISKYFYRIDHAVLMGILERRIKDARMIELLSKIVNSNTNFGLPPWEKSGRSAESGPGK